MRAARHVFAEQGYVGASMRAIASQAGLTAMALYKYASSKDELFLLVWNDSIDRIYAAYTDVVAGHDSLLDELDAVFEEARAILDSDPEHIHFTIRVLHDRPDPDRATSLIDVLAPREFFRELVKRAIARGEIEKGDGPRLVTFVHTVLWGLTSVVALDPARLKATVDAAKWAMHRQFGDRRAP